MSIAKSVDHRLGFYYGWIIVGVALISMAVWFGIRSSFAVFYVALLEEFPWDRAESAGVQSTAMISYTLMAPIVGTLIDRFGPRRIIVPGILILIAGLFLSASIKTLSQFYLYYGVIVGSGVTCIGVVSYSVILAHWFEKKRGFACGVAASGIGLGTCSMVPLSQHLISIFGWRETFIAIGMMSMLVLLPLNALLLRHKPGELNLYIDGLSGEGIQDKTFFESNTGIHPEKEWTISSVLRSVHFWALLIFPFLSVVGLFIILVHNLKFLVDQGIDKMAASYIFSVAAFFSTFFRVFWGWLSDRIGREITYTIGVVFLCAGAGSLLLFETTNETGFVYTFSTFFGMGWGITAPMFMAVATDLFQGKLFGIIYGVVEGCIGAAGALGAWLSGFIFDMTQSYQSAFGLAIVFFLASAAFIWLAAPRKAVALTKMRDE